ncbi:Saccharopine dehydrogenase [Orenia metallireducens]|uniref:Saccharopine dehydrogenase n=1 Tax=Orenia metallireducens TaxID=1413210 RepID=A0A1C0A804_9FIRM|nr:saccharopine dehydrogenase NADP-binding domain-containing protein [Orenia metallireducens]OCL26344.1 Saccharopine dehydrogenase [Orenia metallireducens]
MRDKILVVGGYGKVGQVICKDLGSKFPRKVIAAGRNYEKARRFAQKSNGDILPLEFDIFAGKDRNKVLEEVFLVVMCVDQKDIKFIESCLKNGIHYIDITASYNFLAKVKSLQDTAKASDTTAVLSVGLSPGITNLLVKYSKSHLDVLDRVDISVMLGLGEEHGKAAIEWMIDNINTVFKVIKGGGLKEVKSFEDGKRIAFPRNLGSRITYRFNFVEQHILPKTLNIKTVSHRICFDSKLVTRLLALLKKLGFFNLLKVTLFRKMIIKIFEKINLGSDLFAAKVDALGKKDGKEIKFECSILGNNQSKITGKITSIIANYIYTKKYPAGVYHIEEIFSIEDIMEELSKYIEFYHN